MDAPIENQRHPSTQAPFPPSFITAIAVLKQSTNNDPVEATEHIHTQSHQT
jgi:hypothetical protein